MRLPSRHAVSKTRWIGRHFAWRKLARYHLGIAFLRVAKQTDQSLRSVYHTLEVARRVERMQSLFRKYEIYRFARTGGGWDGGAFATGLIIAATGFLMAKGAAPHVKPIAPLIAVVKPPPIQRQVVQAEPVFGETSGALAAEPVTISVDPASRLKLDYAFAREECLSRLEQTKSYQKLHQEILELQKEVDALRNSDPHGELPGVSLRWIRTKSLLTGMVHSAMLADSKVQRAERAMRAGGLIQPTFPIRTSSPIDDVAASRQAAAND